MGERLAGSAKAQDVPLSSPGWYSSLGSTGNFVANGSRVGSHVDFKTHVENLHLEELEKRQQFQQRPNRTN